MGFHNLHCDSQEFQLHNNYNIILYVIFKLFPVICCLAAGLTIVLDLYGRSLLQ